MFAGRSLEQDVVADVRNKGRIAINQVDALVAYTNWVLRKAAPGFDNTISCAIISGDVECALNGGIIIAGSPVRIVSQMPDCVPGSMRALGQIA